MRALIIDDEPRARGLLSTILEEYCSNINEIFIAENLLEGVKKIKNNNLDVVFLDVEMPEYSGVQIFDFINPDEVDFKLIFTTAYEEYALKAFELNAIDYLLKPLTPLKVKKALEKIEKVQLTASSVNYSQFDDYIKHSVIKKIGLPVIDGVDFVNVEDIILIEADGMYSVFYLKDSSKKIVSKPLKYFHDMLLEIVFFYKPHRSYLINLNYVKKFIKNDSGYVEMEGGKTVSISKDKKEEFLKLLN